MAARKRVRAAVLAVGLLVGVAIVADDAAAAGSTSPDAPVEMLLSTDGVAFAPSLSGRVFHRVGPLVPGESVSAPLWVRNPTDARAHWRVEVGELSATSGAYAEAVTLSARHAAAPGSHTVTLADLSPCDVLASSTLAPGATTKLLLTFGMGLRADNSTQGEAASLRITATMRDGAGGPLGPPACEDGAVTPASEPGPPAALAPTGAAPPAAALALGALAAGAGLVLLALRRRVTGGAR